jgi:hypothetical protein
MCGCAFSVGSFRAQLERESWSRLRLDHRFVGAMNGRATQSTVMGGISR